MDYRNYEISPIGIDLTNGRYAEVTRQKCIHCGRNWIKYHVEFESFSYSRRWYKGIVSEEDLRQITPENAIGCIEKLDWYLYGGSYFSNYGKMGSGKADVDR